MLYVIYKPKGITSFDIIRTLRKKLQIKKMGHIGTLDPSATGVMLIAVGNSTKLIPYLEGGDKTYTFCVDMSGTSASLDDESPITHTKWQHAHTMPQEAIVHKLLSTTHQVPPIYSAIHVNGKRAYKLSRKGRDFTLPERPIQVHTAEVLQYILPEITLRIRLSSGGYIRSFAPVIANWHNTEWWYISMLHREAIHLPNGDTITEEDAQTLENFSPHIHLPLSRALAHFAHIDVQDTQLQNAIINGLPLPDGVFGHINNSHIIATLPNKEVSLLTQEDGVFRVKKNYVYTSSP